MRLLELFLQGLIFIVGGYLLLAFIGAIIALLVFGIKLVWEEYRK